MHCSNFYTVTLSGVEWPFLCWCTIDKLSPQCGWQAYTLQNITNVFWLEGSVTLQLCLELTHRAHARVQTWPRFSPLSMHNGNRNGTTLVASSSFVMPSFLWVSATLYMPTTYIITRGQNNLTKSTSRGPIPQLGVTPGGRKLYHWIPGVGFPISVP